MFKSFSKRIFSELMFKLESFLSLSKLKFDSNDHKRLWVYIFQLEAIRSAQFGKVRVFR